RHGLGTIEPECCAHPLDCLDRVNWDRALSYLGHGVYATPSTTISSPCYRLRRTTHTVSVRTFAIPAAVYEERNFSVFSGEWVPARIRHLYETGCGAVCRVAHDYQWTGGKAADTVPGRPSCTPKTGTNHQT